MYYSGLIPEKFKNITYRTVISKTLNDAKINFRECDFFDGKYRNIEEMFRKKGSDISPWDYFSIPKPNGGFWGSFYPDENKKISDELYPWEIYLKELSKRFKGVMYKEGMYIVDYKLPEDAKVLIVNLCEGDYLQAFKDYNYSMKELLSDYDILIETSGADPFDVPSVCILNKKTLEKLEIIDYFIKDDFESEKDFFIRNGKEIKKDFKEDLSTDCFISIKEPSFDLTEEQRKDPEVINKVIKEFFKLEDSVFYSEKEFRKYPEEMFEILEVLNISALDLLEKEENENDNKRYFGDD